MTDVLEAEAAEIAELEKQVGQGAPDAKTEPKTQSEPEPQEPERQEEETTPDGETERNNRGQFVRRGEHEAAVERYKSAETRAREIEAKYASDMAEVTRRLAHIAEQRQEPKAQEPQIQIPDINTDPIGHFQAQLALRDQKLAEVEKWRTEQIKVSEDDAKRAKIGQEVSRLETEYAKNVPDYGQAQEFLQKHWGAQAQFFGVTPEQAKAFYATQIVQAAVKQNKNPAEIAYEYAQSIGYQKPATNGQQKQEPSRLDVIANGVSKSKSTSAAPGNQPPGQLTAEALLRMDEDEFAAKFGARESKDWDRSMRRLMNGAA